MIDKKTDRKKRKTANKILIIPALLELYQYNALYQNSYSNTIQNPILSIQKEDKINEYKLSMFKTSVDMFLVLSFET